MAYIFMPWAGIQEANGAESADQQRQWLDVAPAVAMLESFGLSGR